MLFETQIHANDASVRVDRYLRKRLPNLSLSRLNLLFRKKEIKIGRKHIAKDTILEEGQDLKVYGLEAYEMDTKRDVTSRFDNSVGWKEKAVFDFEIIHEDDDILVINKPAGIAVHSGTGVDEDETVIDKVQAYLGEYSYQLFKPALVHRLDKDTSGVLVIAKSGPALRHWTEQFRLKSLEKIYIAMVTGVPESSGVIDGNLLRIDSKSGGSKSIVVTEGGKTSKTFFKVLETQKTEKGDYSLLEIKIESGRMHQIRTHLASIEHPILGDSRYGNFELNRQIKKDFGLNRMFLHAQKLKYLKQNGKVAYFEAPLAPELDRFIQALKAKK